MTTAARAAAVALSAAVVLAGALQGASAHPVAQVSLAGKPGLYPSFDPRIHDYVSRCGAKSRLKLTAAAPKGSTASVDGGHARSGTFTTDVHLGGGQGLVVRTSSSARTERYHVRCLPARFPPWSSKTTGATQAQWYIVTPQGPWAKGWVVFFDRDGIPVWWMHPRGLPFNATLLAGNRLIWYRYYKQKFGVRWDTAYEEHRLDGSLVRNVATIGVPTDFHEIQRLPNGHFLLDAYRPRHGVDLRPYGGAEKSTVYDAEIQELTKSGKRVWKWNSKNHIDLSETGRWWPKLMEIQGKLPESKRAYDQVHINSIAIDGDGLVISARHTDAVYRIDKATGQVDWKLGGTQTPESLSIVGDPKYGPQTFAGQHDARVLPDGTLTVFDNGTARRPPRDVRYAIDTKAGTATLLEQLTDPDVPSSQWGGSARKLPGGNWVTSWGGEPYVTEMTPAGDQLFRLTLPNSTSYRVFPIPFGTLSGATLRAAMDKMHPRRHR